jgi:thiol:disulfide interchange protein DsbD
VLALAGGLVPSAARADFLADLEAPFRAAIESGSATSMLGLAFLAGLATSLTPCVVAAALTGDVFGSQLSHPAVSWGLALLLVAFAASMFGAFELDLPSGLKNRLALVGGSGLRGACSDS